MPTHLIPCFARSSRDDKFVALCGERVSGWEHAANGTPECQECARIDAEDERSLLALTQTTQADFGGPPVKHHEFDPTAGYVPRGQRRTR